MSHMVEKIFQETRHSWKVRCTCGWTEAALTENAAKLRFVTHARGNSR